MRPTFRHSRKFPPGFQIDPQADFVACRINARRIAVKVNEPVGGDQGYVVFTDKGVSTGELLNLEEVQARINLNEN